jgi:hypothetical protein
MPRLSASRREILSAYAIVIQTPGDGTIVQRVARFLDRPLNINKDNSHIRKVIKQYQENITQSA